jgi:enterochelin esterase-like enzyme
MKQTSSAYLESLCYPQLSHFDISILSLQSQVLKKNPLGDSSLRKNPILSPKNQNHKNLGVVFVLSGFAGNGTKYLGDKGFDQSFIQQLDLLFAKNQAPEAHYVFVDAWTFWGGSQFVNSPATGNYEDYIIKELYPAVLKILSINASAPKAIMGQSSGGYGALHLASSYPEHFSFCGALAPDCGFEMSLLPDFYKAAPYLLKNKNYEQLLSLHKKGSLLKQKNGFSILNAIAMAACYSPLKVSHKIAWPINLSTGQIETSTWKQWLTKDPVYFLEKRLSKVKKLSGIFLDVGERDEFHLQFGLRQIHENLKSHKVKHHYSEFEGGHFEAHERYPLFWEWLKKEWKK